MCCSSFIILTDSIIIFCVWIRLIMQAHNVYVKCYRSHLYLIQLRYSSLNRIEFSGLYAYAYIYEIENELFLKKNLLLYLLNINDLVMNYLHFFVSFNLHLRVT